ncbi:hypothetical protein ILUMI_25179 [Ignelater luminosus]|uniref:Uncharacterized protein n=1 Tax=Ignelater luminosus TaxID=2038154 RepID=A0A8K0G059_IGNLU|nr:hypothetical protein ILUMI_25179 [Ignelater luminosus]
MEVLKEKRKLKGRPKGHELYIDSHQIFREKEAQKNCEKRESKLTTSKNKISEARNKRKNMVGRKRPEDVTWDTVKQNDEYEVYHENEVTNTPQEEKRIEQAWEEIWKRWKKN